MKSSKGVACCTNGDLLLFSMKKRSMKYCHGNLNTADILAGCGLEIPQMFVW